MVGDVREGLQKRPAPIVPANRSPVMIAAERQDVVSVVAITPAGLHMMRLRRSLAPAGDARELPNRGEKLRVAIYGHEPPT